MNFIFPSDIKGYTSGTEGKLLYKLAQKNPHLGSVVELGTFHGRSAVCLAQGSKKVGGGKVFTVDNFTGDKYVGAHLDFYPEFKKNIKRWKLEEEIVALRGDTVNIAKEWKKPIRFLFLDADHSYQRVALDASVWERYIVSGGIVAFHDSLCWLGVYKFVFKLIMSGDFKNFKTLTADSMGVTYAFKKAKGEKITNFERGKNLLGLVLISLPKLPVLVRVYASQRDESDFWYRFFDWLAKFYRKLERVTKKWV